MLTAKQKFRKYLMPIGLLCMSASFIIGHYTRLSDFFEGFLKGMGIVFILVSFPYKKRKTAS